MTQQRPDAGGDSFGRPPRARNRAEEEKEDALLDQDSELYGEKWGDDWPRAVIGVAAAEIKRLRVELELSQHDLAEACAEIGYPIPRNVLANLESGRRESLQVVELLVLAKALACSPVSILFPVAYRETVHPLPGEPRDSLAAADWVSDVPNSTSDFDISYQLPFYREIAKARETRERNLWTVRQAKEDLRRETRLEKRRELQATLSTAQANVANADATVARLKAYLEEDGLRVPIGLP
ncbi:helix-turn-helix transcriptional regulator [Streptacidiphilus sp. MAP5-3]|uniref:helix-turn-helix transcriptional regulator n=1 Tax=unclassified Streptacidiphilus TaxID=2643834 RepID=UPI00351437B8